jgi:predicted phage terminase large subunit-like protein
MIANSHKRIDYGPPPLARRRRASGGGVSLRDFVAQVNPRYQWYRHCEVLADALEKVVRGECLRLMVFMPPRHGKSELISRLFSAYYLYCHPDRWVGVNSYAADLAYTFSRSARDNYTRVGGALRGDAAAVKHWQTPQGGGLWAAGVGGPITGKGFHLGIIDDPLKNAEEAQSEIIRRKQQDWYHSTFYTRQEPDAAIVIVQTRWHEDDLSGGILAAEEDGAEGWVVINLPAIAEDSPTVFPPSCSVVDDWREVGAPLCPERYPLERLNKIAARIGDYFFSALFQQRPRPKSGNQFKREWFEIVPAAPRVATRVRYWDKAGADEGKGDWTVGTLMARTPSGTFIVEDVVRFQKIASARNAVILQTAQMDGQDVAIYVEQPPGLAKESTDAVVKMLAGYAVYADPVTRDKVERAEPFQAQAQAGNGQVIKADWNKAWFDELEAFPHGKYDDQVDSGSGAFNKLADIMDVTVHRPAPTTNRWKVL